MAANLPEGVVKLLQRPVFAHVATLMKDGSPQVTPVWIDTDGQYVYINTAEGRIKPRNLRRDGRVAISVMDTARPYQDYALIRGRVVEITPEGAWEHIDKLSRKYNGRDYPRRPGEVRLKVKIEPLKVGGPAARG